MRAHLYRIFGVDLTEIPGINALTAHVLYAEIWSRPLPLCQCVGVLVLLGLCSDNRVSGGKILSVRTRAVKNRATMALRMSGQALHGSRSYLGNCFRRMRAKLGGPKATTAATHKLARIVYHLLTTRQSYQESVLIQYEKLNQRRTGTRLRRQARSLRFDLIKAPT
jgi:transposase